MIFAAFDVLLAVNMCINYSFFFTFMGAMSRGFMFGNPTASVLVDASDVCETTAVDRFKTLIDAVYCCMND